MLGIVPSPVGLVPLFFWPELGTRVTELGTELTELGTKVTELGAEHVWFCL